MNKFDIFTAIALRISSSISAKDRYQHLLIELGKIIPFQAACLFEKVGTDYVPVATIGLIDETLSRNYSLQEHPRLKAIANSASPIIFPPESRMPDPFDGMLIIDKEALNNVHACLGCPLMGDDELIGMLTADSLETNAFDMIDREMLKAITALAGAVFRTNKLIKNLEKQAEIQSQISKDLMKSSFQRSGGEIVGISPSIEALRKSIELIAKSDFSVLITGETGTGKELVARAIHESSLRSEQPLIYINCAALPESIAEIELFGHVKNPQQGFHSERLGKFEVANGGTIFLDEIGELPMSIQTKLLHVLQEGYIQKLGADKMKKINIRILTATNRNLEEEIKNNRFRVDLYHRLKVYPIHVPPLRDHREDISILIGYFADITRKKQGLATVRFNEDARNLLKAYAWPGNIRELKNTVARIILNAATQAKNKNIPILITPKFLGEEFIDQSKSDWHLDSNIETKIGDAKKYLGIPLKDAVEEFQRALILETVEDQKGNWSKSAELLGIDRSNLHNLAKKLGIK